jgi:hypothetical protein
VKVAASLHSHDQMVMVKNVPGATSSGKITSAPRADRSAGNLRPQRGAIVVPSSAPPRDVLRRQGRRPGARAKAEEGDLLARLQRIKATGDRAAIKRPIDRPGIKGASSTRKLRDEVLARRGRGPRRPTSSGDPADARSADPRRSGAIVGCEDRKQTDRWRRHHWPALEQAWTDWLRKAPP